MKKIRILLFVLLFFAVVTFGLYCLVLRKQDANQPPEIGMDGDLLYVSATSDEAVLLEGVRAWDPEDGDVSNSIVVESISVFDEDGFRTVTYAAFDSDYHVARATRKIAYTDYQSPTFQLSGPLSFTAWDDKTILAMISASDVMDGDISYRVSITGDELLDTYTGLYEVQFSVTNSAGDLQTVPVYLTLARTAKSVPVIVLSEYLTYVDKGSTFDPLTYVTAVESGVPGETLTATAESSVDTDVPGSYIVSYSVINSLGYEGNVYLTVVVR
ncbi:MAG: hypothetical protein ACI3YK_04720 [Eubacteriales bacterium]